MIKHLPNILTVGRVLIIPVLAVVYYAVPSPWSNIICTILFVLASVTDWLDGYLARQLNISSPFGAFLDPVADKLLVAFALICLSSNYATVWFVLPAGVIICREITVSALREWMAGIGKRSSVAVAFVGKVKTAAQMFAISFLLWEHEFYGIDIALLGMIALYVAALLTVWSMIGYFIAAGKNITEQQSGALDNSEMQQK